MSKVPRTLIKSRETLQAISNNWQELRKYEVFDRTLDYISSEIFKIQKGKIFQAINFAYILHNIARDLFVYNNYNNNTVESFRLELIEILKKEYPGCDIRYTETTGYEGKIVEQLIIIDWS